MTLLDTVRLSSTSVLTHTLHRDSPETVGSDEEEEDYDIVSAVEAALGDDTKESS